MLFTEPSFLFYFLPVLLALHMVAPRPVRNLLLLLASLVFYAWGEPVFVFALLISMSFNHGVGLWIESSRSRAQRRAMALGVGGNLALLAYFKYAGFAVSAVGAGIAGLGFPEVAGLIPVPEAHLPIGISFFTFQAISYLVDIGRGQARAQRNFVDVALYISMFPQLIAGPIIRYVDVEAQLRDRQVDVAGFAVGVRRFVQGLAKKLVIANTLAWPADQVFSAAEAGTGTVGLGPSLGVAWLAILCFSLQIYFDFSGYSDMAIGLARMFGFRYRENFDYPYISASITEFWRRWHISLSTWFRDYLYIPLGGGRGSPARVAGNLALVFLLCGLWHGAAWGFLIWGAYHGALLSIERVLPLERLPQGPAVARRIVTALLVAVGWVFFRADSLTGVGAMLAALVGLGSGDPAILGLPQLFDLRLALVLLLACAGATPLPARWAGRARERFGVLGAGCDVAYATALLLVAATLIASGSYEPFLYFRF